MSFVDVTCVNFVHVSYLTFSAETKCFIIYFIKIIYVYRETNLFKILLFHQLIQCYNIIFYNAIVYYHFLYNQEIGPIGSIKKSTVIIPHVSLRLRHIFLRKP